MSSVVIHIDLISISGHSVVEVRSAQNATIYSCAYGNQSSRILAIRRAQSFCLQLRLNITNCIIDNSYAAWQ